MFLNKHNIKYDLTHCRFLSKITEKKLKEGIFGWILRFIILNFSTEKNSAPTWDMVGYQT